ATNTYISPNMVAQSIVNQFCRSGRLERSIQTVRAALRERRDATCGARDRHLPDARYVTPEGGYFLWVDLPEGTAVAELARRSAERGVVFEQGSGFMIEGGESSLRLAYSAVPPDQIEEGIARIAEAYRELPAPARA
nr:aminotransferase class I/II-fold pyridoxal phosphate-dependent enzyme [Thermoleophilaceae bacterium]